MLAIGLLLTAALAVEVWHAPHYAAPGMAAMVLLAVEGLRQLRGGKHLMIVRYELRHDPGDEWVYNGADLDGPPVVWARELDPASNRKLLDYFADRKAWLVEPDHRRARVTAYNLQDATAWARRVRERLLEVAGGHPLSCGEWSELYSRAAGTRPPKPDPACYGAAGSDAGVPFENWHRWLQQRQQADLLTP